MKIEQEKEAVIKRYEDTSNWIEEVQSTSRVDAGKSMRGIEHPIIGYTAGVFDMFHIGHLNILKNAKQLCDFLIVAVSTDEVVEINKHKKPIIPFADRIKIVEAIRYVDKVVPQTSYSIEGKKQAAIDNHIHYMFVGDDWKGTDKWKAIENTLAEVGVEVIYLPHTDGISSTMLREKTGLKCAMPEVST